MAEIGSDPENDFSELATAIIENLENHFRIQTVAENDGLSPRINTVLVVMGD